MAKHDIDDWILDETELAEHYRAAGKVECDEDKMELVGFLKQLKEYQQLEEQGRLVILPCKVGDTVYAIIYDYEVEQYAIKKSEIIEVRENINGIFFVSLINKPAFKFNDFGKTIFLTKSEAEAKLKELRCNND